MDMTSGWDHDYDPYEHIQKLQYQFEQLAELIEEMAKQHRNVAHQLQNLSGQTMVLINRYQIQQQQILDLHHRIIELENK